MTVEKLVESRLISGAGLLRIPADAENIYYWSVLIDVVRPPSRIFRSNKFNPSRQRYATITALKDGYVLDEQFVDYPRRRFDIVLDSSAQTLLAVKCAYQGTLISIANLATALSLPVISIDDLVKPMESLNLVADSLHFVCEQDTALQVRLFSRDLISCNEESVKQPKQPPPPPPQEPLPPGEPIGDITPPYDEEDTVTNPNPIDEDSDPNPAFPDFPLGEECERYRVEVAMTSTLKGREVRVDEFYGEIEELFFNPSSVSQDGKETILIRSRGLAVFNGAIQPCGSPILQILLQESSEEYLSHELISVTPVV